MDNKKLVIIGIIAIAAWYFLIRKTDETVAKGKPKEKAPEYGPENPPENPPGNEPTTPENGEPENGEPENGEPENGEPENGEPENGEPEGEIPAGKGPGAKAVTEKRKPAGDRKPHFGAPKVAMTRDKKSDVMPDDLSVEWTVYLKIGNKKTYYTEKFRGIREKDDTHWLKRELTKENKLILREIRPDDGKPHFGASKRAK